MCHFGNDLPAQPSMSDRVEVFWPIRNKFYACEVTRIIDDRICAVSYGDDDQETLNTTEETWSFESSLSASSIKSLKYSNRMSKKSSKE